MEQENIQLLFNQDSITVNASLFDGVLTTKTFDGPDCYPQLLDFFRQSFAKNDVIHAAITIG